MSRHLLNLAGLVCILGCLPSASAQDQPITPSGVSHIDPAAVAADQKRQADDHRVKAESETHKEQFVLRFVAKELEGGRVINTREYSVRTYVDSTYYAEAQIRTGARVPVSTGPPGGSNFTYIDVGINFDLHKIQLAGPNLNMQVEADISSYKDAPSGSQPVIQSNRWLGSVTIPIGKTATIFSSDDVVSKRTLQVDLTVTRI